MEETSENQENLGKSACDKIFFSEVNLTSQEKLRHTLSPLVGNLLLYQSKFMALAALDGHLYKS
jgi:hypothetical protein